jgi:hypothetical protein
MGLAQYVTSECHEFVEWATMLGEVVDVAWLSTMDESSMLT